jgi:hypothetical protein
MKTIAYMRRHTQNIDVRMSHRDEFATLAMKANAPLRIKKNRAVAKSVVHTAVNSTKSIL